MTIALSIILSWLLVFALAAAVWVLIYLGGLPLELAAVFCAWLGGIVVARLWSLR